jgi:oligopeptide transport system substrate-binding protein
VRRVCVLGTVLCLLAASPVGVGAQTAAAPQEVTVNFLTQGEPDTLDPNRASFAYAADGAVIRQVFEPLLRFDANLVPQPAAAASYEVSADGLTYTFHLRGDGRWSDGQPVTARQFAYSWKRLLDPALHAEYAPLFVDAGIVGADAYNRGRTSTADAVGVTAVDDQTLQIRLTQPFGALPDLAALWVGAPLREDLVAADPDGWASDPETYVVNGPFVVSDWEHQDHLTLEPNPQYVAHLGWPKPTLTKVTVSMNTNPEVDYAAYTSGKRDWVLVPDLEVNHVLNDGSLTGQAHQSNELTTFWLQMNAARPGLSNVLVRRALSKAIDRAALVRDLTAGLSLPTTSVLPPGMPGFQDGLGKELGFDPVGARALLTQIGSQPQLTFSFAETPSNRRRALYLQDQWRTNLGIEVQLNPMDQAAYQQAIDARNYDLAFGGWNADYPDPQDWLGLVFGCNAVFNKFNNCNPSFDQLTARADMAVNLTDRLPLYAQAQTLLVQDVPVAPLFVRGRLVLIQPWVQSIDGGPLVVSPLDDYPGSLFLDKVQILPH